MKKAWHRLKLAAGVLIGAGYVYNLAVDGLPVAGTARVLKLTFYTGTSLGFAVAGLLIWSGLRGLRKLKREERARWEIDDQIPPMDP